MDVTDNKLTLDKVSEVLRHVRGKGVRVWARNGQLCYKAPKGILTEEEINSLRSSRDQILTLLEGASRLEIDETRLPSDTGHDLAPLTFSQLAHWNLYQLAEQPSFCPVLSATRLRGRLDLNVLRRSVTAVTHRHDALRTRIVVCNGAPMQKIDEPIVCDLTVADLTMLPEELGEAEVNQVVEKLIIEPIDVSKAPLFEVCLIRLGESDHVLVVTMEHIIADQFSMNIFLRDLLTVYPQALKGRYDVLGRPPMQFADYAVWQRRTHGSWLEMHSAYWNGRLGKFRRLRFPEQRTPPQTEDAGWGAVPIRIDKGLTAELRGWCRDNRTTLALTVFTAYISAVLLWCDVAEGVFLYESDGRGSPAIANTVGYFAAPLYLHITISGNDTLIDLLKQVTEEYCDAYTHADFSYLEAQIPKPDFTKNCIFNWIPRHPQLDELYLGNLDDALAYSPFALDCGLRNRIQRETEPITALIEGVDTISGGVQFSKKRHDSQSMTRFAGRFLAHVEALVRQSERSIQDITFR